MNKRSPIRILNESDCTSDSADLAGIVDIEFDISAQPIHFRIGVTEDQITLADIVPVARTISNKITDTAVAAVRSDGGQIPCRQYCSACCGYLVSLSVPEAFKLQQETLRKPQYQKKYIQRSCLLAARNILKQKPPKWFLSKKHYPALIVQPI